MPHRFLAALAMLLLTTASALAASVVAGFPDAAQPLGTLPDAVLLDQGAGCPTNTAPCTTSQSPSVRVGQPYQGASPPATPFLLQPWFDTNDSTLLTYSFYDGTQWVPLATLDTVNHEWTLVVGGIGMTNTASNAILPTAQVNLGIGAAGLLGIGSGLGSSGGNIVATLPNYGSGCLLSNDGTTPNTTIGIAACYTADDTTFFLMPKSSASTKTTGAWSTGSGGGCLDTGTVANSTWYHLYQIQRADTGVVDFLCTATFGAPTLPASYGRKRFIGSFMTDASAHILLFTQIGNEFIWKAPVADVAAATCTTTAASATLTRVPTGRKIEANTRVSVVKAADSPLLLVSPLDEDDNPPDTPTGNLTLIAYVLGKTATTPLRVMTNTTQQVRQRCSVTGASVTIVTAGWRDPSIAWQH